MDYKLATFFIGLISICLTCFWAPIKKHILYAGKVEKRVKRLREAMEKLENRKKDVKVRILENQRKRISVTEDRTWLKKVVAMETQVAALEEEMKATAVASIPTPVVARATQVADIEANEQDRQSRIARWWFNIKKWRSSHRIGMAAVDRLKEVEDLLKDQPQQATREAVPSAVQEMPAAATSTAAGGVLVSCREEACSFLKDEKQGTLGILGMGGVGKTTLLTRINEFLRENNSQYDKYAQSLRLQNMDEDEIHRRLRKKKFEYGFDCVVFIVASRACTVEKVQEDIIVRLGLEKGGDASSIIFSFLKTKNFVLLLDDLWERLDLEKVGIPHPLGMVNGRKRKVILTTRSNFVCGNMEARRKIKVPCLQPEAAWSLFQEKVGEQVIINSHPAIPQLAKKVAAECAGLPLALITIGRAMSSKKTPQDWEHALRLLRKSQLSNIPGTHKDEDPFPVLKFSYDNLDNDRTRECFLCCALWPEDYEIREDDLIQCWMGHDLIDDYGDINEAYGTGHSILSTLQTACLLESRVDYFPAKGSFFSSGPPPPVTVVKMHDVIRDLALWIARDCGKNQNKWMVHAGANLREAPQDERLWREAEKISLMCNEIEELLPSSLSSPCPKLTTLILQQKNYASISEGIKLPANIQANIQFFGKLQYLDLSHNTELSMLPKEICSLVELQYLNLSDTGIESLPKEMSHLVNLKYLHLRNSTLVSFPRGLLPQLVKLKVLDVYRDTIGFLSNSCVIDELRGFITRTRSCLVALGINVLTATDFKTLIQLSPPMIRSLNMHLLEGVTSISLSKTARNGMRFSFISKFADELVVESNGGLPCLETLRFSRLYSLEKIIWKGVAQQAFLPSLRNVIIENCFELKDVTWVIRLPFLVYLRLYDCRNMEHVIDEGVLGVIEEEERKAAFQCLSVLFIARLHKLRSICDDSFTFPALQRVSMLKIPASVHVTPQIKEKWLPRDSPRN